ncbi:MAG TPA: sigma-70 family RNA polymerase sigma factor [Verrucomicrobiae bacterium]|jgi:RNA polymerase sigma-70 factor (ECF subfamily)
MNACAQIDFGRVFPALNQKSFAGSLRLSKNVSEQDAQDIELLRQIAAGDRAAFAQFYDSHSVLMYSVACKILGDTNEAQDVVQEAFMQIWEKASKFDPKLGKPSSWAAILVRNKAIDRIRASQRRTRLAEEAGAEETSQPKGDDPANEAVYGREKARLIQSAIVELPEEQRRAIELAYFSGLTQDEISKKLSEPLGTIKARIRRGLLKLRDQLEGLL